MTTLKVPGSVVLCEFSVCSSAVEKDRERTWAMGRGGDAGNWADGCLGLSFTWSSSGSRGASVRVGVREPYKLCSQSLLDERALESSVALSGGVCGGKTNGSGDGRVRWCPGRTTGLR
jgi:hypothetical protein